MEIKVKDEILVDDILINNGFKLHKIDTTEQINKVKKLGIKSSPLNSCRIWERDNKYYIFDGWEADGLGRMAKSPKYINIIELRSD